MELFKKKDNKADDTAEHEKKLQILNEYLSDQFLERMSGVMMKQFTESEQMLKLLMQKYMDQQAAETDNIKATFKIDYDKLEQMKEDMSGEDHLKARQRLEVDEENLLREVALRIQNAHKNEEAALRKELEKKHAQDQVQFRAETAEKQGKLRTRLLGDSELIQQENKQDKKVLERFEQQKKTEQERRLRNIELQKKQLHHQFESDIKDKFGDFEEMLRRKKEKQKEQAEEAAALRLKLEEHKASLKKKNSVEGMSKED